MNTAWIILGVGVLLLSIKFTAWQLTGSLAIYSDALESIINVITGIIGVVAIRISSMPADQSHPYGHGKIEYFSAGLEGIFILAAGISIIIAAVQSIVTPPVIQSLTVGTVLIGISGLGNGILGLFLVNKGKRIASPTFIGSGYHVLSDAYTSFGVVAGLILVNLTGILWLDTGIAILVSIHILWSGGKIVYLSVNRLLDGTDQTVINKIAEVLQHHRRPEWIAPHKLRSWKGGTRLFVDFHLIMPWYYTLEEIHDEEHLIYELIAEGFIEPTEVIIHTEPCNPSFCSRCSMKTCPHREVKQSEKPEWSGPVLMEELFADEHSEER